MECSIFTCLRQTWSGAGCRHYFRGLGKIATIPADSTGERNKDERLKYICEAVSYPKTPSPHLMTFKYTSKICFLSQNNSIKFVKYPSRILLNQVRSSHKKRFGLFAWK
jgi:hypothetical protein